MTASLRLFPALLLLASFPVAAQYPPEQYPPDPYQDPAYLGTDAAENVSYGYAQVLRADAVVEQVLTMV
ncbi:MAG: hypothetical protein KA187_08015, partial [Arenimonas sp.]|nr:hypothetical protein [Arenimonas sp.]